ncbi:unnamed protein product [Gongylonema pulchrum]|uniref:G_PROTEIN_RECEP_F1_2 domain-containing protein n=1 Tax=Gongylonema pulchrum TaxID=637853 RepID=A0A183CVF4_9BILA|nr:unnamed protein product [Gongylonema pulchrum]
MNESEITECAEKNEAYDGARFALVVYIGTPIAIVGILFNGILLALFCNKKSVHSHSFYLLFLAIFDMLICMLYIPFFTVDALAIYYQISALHHLWHTYFGAVYMMLCATFERYVYVSGKMSLHWLVTDSGRLVTVIVVLIIAFLVRLPAFFDYRIAHSRDCPPFQDYLFIPVLTSYPLYAQYNFYMMSIVQTIAPFILLTLFNITTIYLTRKRLYHTPLNAHVELPGITSMLMQESANRRSREELKYATRTMVAIVFTYLSCNVFSVFVSVVENVFPDSSILYNSDGSSTKFYTITADLISILVALNSLLRLVVYFMCNPQFRKRFMQLFLKSKSSSASL